MKKHESHAEATYGPQAFKSFEGALFSFLKSEVPQIGGDRTRQLLVSEIQGMVRKFYPATGHLEQGQAVWTTVHKDATGSYGKRIQDTELTTVVLSLVGPTDAAERAEGRSLRDMRKDAIARLCNQAYDQDGCLTAAELSLLTKVCASTVGKYIKEWEEEHKAVLPRRGTIHDMGPTLTHKRIIIEKLFIERKTVQQTARETRHSLPAIQRYISGFRQVLLCRQKGMTRDETAYAVKMTGRLVDEYLRIIEEYAERSYVLEKLLNYCPHIENNLEAWANDYGSGN